MLTNYGIRNPLTAPFIWRAESVILIFRLLCIRFLISINSSKKNGVFRAESVTLTLFNRVKFTGFEIAALHCVTLVMTDMYKK